jgi:hypothetical protein
MRKAIRVAEEVLSPASQRLCRSIGIELVGVVEHSRGDGLPGASRAVRPAAASAPVLRAQALAREVILSRGACALGTGCTSRAWATCGARVAASREAAAYCGMRSTALLPHLGLAEVI